MYSLKDIVMELSCSSPLSVNSTVNRFSTPLGRRVSVYSHRKNRYVCSVSSTCRSAALNVSARASCSTSSSSSSLFGVSVSAGGCGALPRKGKRSLSIVCGVFERFTERAVKAVVSSQKEAKALGKDTVFTEHLLLGLIAEDRGSGGFLSSGITIEKAREAVRSIWNDDNAKSGSEDSGSAISATNVGFSASVKRVFEAAVEYSRTMGHNFIAPEHIAVGLCTVEDRNTSLLLERYNLRAKMLLSIFCLILCEHVESVCCVAYGMLLIAGSVACLLDNPMLILVNSGILGFLIRRPWSLIRFVLVDDVACNSIFGKC